MAVSKVCQLFSSGQMNAPLMPGVGARIMVAVVCDAEYATGANWGCRMYSYTSQEHAEWSNDPDLVALNNDSSGAFPTLVLSDVDLAYPYNELTVFWNGDPNPAPEFGVRAWVIY